MRQILKIILLTLAPLSVFALPADSSQPLHVTADSSIFNYKTGMTVYEGNVLIDQGSTHIAADRLITKANAHHKIQRAVAYGLIKPAEYSTVPKPGEALFHASANVIKFFPPLFKIILEGGVIVFQGNNSFHGELIIYNTKDQTVSAPASKGSRTTLVLEAKEIKTS